MDDDEQPNLSTIPGRLKWARMEAGYRSPRAAAKNLGWPENTYKAHEQGLRGSEGLKNVTAEKYARGFRVDVGWLMSGKGSPKPTSETERQWRQMDEAGKRLALRLVNATTHAQDPGPAPDAADELPAWFKKKPKADPEPAPKKAPAVRRVIITK